MGREDKGALLHETSSCLGFKTKYFVLKSSTERPLDHFVLLVRRRKLSKSDEIYYIYLVIIISSGYNNQNNVISEGI